MAVVPQKLLDHFSDADSVPLAAADLPHVGELMGESGEACDCVYSWFCLCVKMFVCVFFFLKLCSYYS